jgi:hypothetical protein
MASAVYCIVKGETQAVRIANRLRAEGFAPSDISILYPDRGAARDLGHENATKAPEGTAIGVPTGAVLGGALGWLVGVGALAIPGLGPFIAAGPLLAALSGAFIGGATGGVAGALVGMGIPEYEAQMYEGKLREGNILMAVHCKDSDETSRVREIYSEEQAENISTGSEASVPDRNR